MRRFLKILGLIILLLPLWLIKFGRAASQDFSSGETYLIASKNTVGTSLLPDSSFRGNEIYNLDDVFIAQLGGTNSLNDFNNFTESCPLPQPVDSLMSLYFRSTHLLKQSAFILQLKDTCRIQMKIPFDFQINRSPLKEVNIFTVNGLQRDEFYFDLNLNTVRVDSQMQSFLFFEYLWQVFLKRKVLTDKIYSESALSTLACAYRPIYAPELHFYLEEGAADEMVRQWVRTKRAFLRFASPSLVKKEYAEFLQKLKLVVATPHAKMIVWAKLMRRYGYHENLKGLFEHRERFLDHFRKKLPRFIRAMQLIWFRSSVLQTGLIKALRAEKIQGGVRMFIQ